MQMNLETIQNYKEKTLYITPDYEHMLKFKTGETESFYYIDNNDKFWFEKSFFDKIQIPITGMLTKFFNTENGNQSLFIRISSIEEVFSIINAAFDEKLYTLFTIITSNKRWGTPRKNITYYKNSYNIQFSNSTEDNFSVFSETFSQKE